MATARKEVICGTSGRHSSFCSVLFVFSWKIWQKKCGPVQLDQNVWRFSDRQPRKESNWCVVPLWGSMHRHHHAHVSASQKCRSSSLSFGNDQYLMTILLSVCMDSWSSASNKFEMSKDKQTFKIRTTSLRRRRSEVGVCAGIGFNSSFSVEDVFRGLFRAGFLLVVFCAWQWTHEGKTTVVARNEPPCRGPAAWPAGFSRHCLFQAIGNKSSLSEKGVQQQNNTICFVCIFYSFFCSLHAECRNTPNLTCSKRYIIFWCVVRHMSPHKNAAWVQTCNNTSHVRTQRNVHETARESNLMYGSLLYVEALLCGTAEYTAVVCNQRATLSLQDICWGRSLKFFLPEESGEVQLSFSVLWQKFTPRGVELALPNAVPISAKAELLGGLWLSLLDIRRISLMSVLTSKLLTGIPHRFSLWYLYGRNSPAWTSSSLLSDCSVLSCRIIEPVRQSTTKKEVTQSPARTFLHSFKQVKLWHGTHFYLISICPGYCLLVASNKDTEWFVRLTVCWGSGREWMPLGPSRLFRCERSVRRYAAVQTQGWNKQTRSDQEIGRWIFWRCVNNLPVCSKTKRNRRVITSQTGTVKSETSCRSPEVITVVAEEGSCAGAVWGSGASFLNVHWNQIFVHNIFIVRRLLIHLFLWSFFPFCPVLLEIFLFNLKGVDVYSSANKCHHWLRSVARFEEISLFFCRHVNWRQCGRSHWRGFRLLYRDRISHPARFSFVPVRVIGHRCSWIDPPCSNGQMYSYVFSTIHCTPRFSPFCNKVTYNIPRSVPKFVVPHAPDRKRKPTQHAL